MKSLKLYLVMHIRRISWFWIWFWAAITRVLGQRVQAEEQVLSTFNKKTLNNNRIMRSVILYLEDCTTLRHVYQIRTRWWRNTEKWTSYVFSILNKIINAKKNNTCIFCWKRGRAFRLVFKYYIFLKIQEKNRL